MPLILAYVDTARRLRETRAAAADEPLLLQNKPHPLHVMHSTLTAELHKLAGALERMAKHRAAPVEGGRQGAPGKRRTPARPGVPSTSASKGTSKPNWIDELRERREQQAPKQAG
jgi:hypothetical protein